MKLNEAHRRFFRKRLLAVIIAATTVTLFIVPPLQPPNYFFASFGRILDIRASNLQTTSSQKALRVAFVKPVFTSTAYESGGFYAFYSLHKHIPNGTYVRKDLNMLNLSVIDSWGWSSGLGSFITSNYAKNNNLLLGKNAFVINDVNVTKGGLFDRAGSRAYDVVVVGFAEYVTDTEYNQYLKFVQDGGKIVFLDAANFLGKVNYDPATNRVIFVESHYYKFNGTAVGAGVYDYYRSRNAHDFGSVFSLFKTSGYRINGATPILSNPLGQALHREFGKTIFQSYRPHEENAIANPRDRVIALWNVTGLKNRNLIIASYELRQGNGIVIHTGVFGSDIISFDRQMQFFLIRAIFSSSPAQNDNAKPSSALVAVTSSSNSTSLKSSKASFLQDAQDITISLTVVLLALICLICYSVKRSGKMKFPSSESFHLQSHSISRIKKFFFQILSQKPILILC